MHILQYCLLIAHNCYELLKNFTILFIVFYASCHWRMSWNMQAVLLQLRQRFTGNSLSAPSIHDSKIKKDQARKRSMETSVVTCEMFKSYGNYYFLLKSVVPVPPTHLLHNLESGDSWSLHQFALIHHHSKICFPKVIRMEQKMVTAKIPPCHDKYTGKQNILHSNFKVNTQ